MFKAPSVEGAFLVLGAPPSGKAPGVRKVDGQFREPEDVTVAPDGIVYATVLYHSRSASDLLRTS